MMFAPGNEVSISMSDPTATPERRGPQLSLLTVVGRLSPRSIRLRPMGYGGQARSGTEATRVLGLRGGRQNNWGQRNFLQAPLDR